VQIEFEESYRELSVLFFSNSDFDYKNASGLVNAMEWTTQLFTLALKNTEGIISGIHWIHFFGNFGMYAFLWGLQSFYGSPL